MTSVTVSIVLHESADDIAACLTALREQTRQPDQIVMLDNGSRDDGLAIARQALPDIRPIRSEANLGFAAGHNRAMAAAPADVHLVLNPDCRPAPDFLALAVQTLESDQTAGSVTGRLLRFRPDEEDGGPLEELADDVLDSTGMVALRNRRVLDRGDGLQSDGRYVEPDEVFGASGAAAVYRRAMLEDVAVGDEVFDESFFAYREDVDLAWRAQLLGWRCRYVPAALARHRRRVAPGRRRELPARINRLSVANRWRMLAKNETWAGWRRDGAVILARDAGILGYCLVREQRTLAAVADVLRDARRLRRWRRLTMTRRRASDEAMLAWFGRETDGP